MRNVTATTAREERAQGTVDARRKQTDWRLLIAKYGTTCTLLILVAGFTLARPDVFFTRFNLLNILSQGSILLIVSIGLTVCLVMGLYDLSISAIATLGNYLVCSLLVIQKGEPHLWPTILVVVAVCALVGIMNGVIVSYVGISAFIGTMAVGSVLTGVVLAYSDTKTIIGGIPDSFLALGQESTLGIPNPVLIVGAAFIFLWVLLEHTQIGRNLYAIGGSAEGAKLSGIAVRRYALVALGISAVCAAVGGMIASANLGAARPTGVGEAYLLNAFAASFIGASTLRPGQFHLLGTLIGVLIIGVIGNGLSIMGVQTYWQYIVQGGLLLVAMFGAGIISGRKA